MRITVIFMAERAPKVRESSRNLYNLGVQVLYSWSDIFLVTKTRRMKWTLHVARMGEEREGKRHLKYQ
jgi:hypothetical protein